MRKHTYSNREFNYDNGSTERQGLYIKAMWLIGDDAPLPINACTVMISPFGRGRNYCRNFCKT